ncbi:MAG TPA: 3-hydroxyacyl-CoA dehydrogenase/enoyl-CoA hydratase family protein [Longimicrobiales bacterium]
MRIHRIGVVGAGAMGRGIAALAASAGVPAVLLDVAGEEDRDEPARRGLEAALRSTPAGFMDPARAALVEIGNTEDDLDRLAACDWVVEAIVERPEPKRALYERLEGVLHPDAIVTTNTSGIPMRVLAEGRSASFRRRFLGTHFFNPPRYQHLLELIPAADTDPAVVDAVANFGDRVLGKGIVVAKDAPGFIANRLGVYGLVGVIRLMEAFGLAIDEVDALTGPLIGRPKSATFRTADLAGLDVLAHVTAGLSAATGEDFSLPAWVRELVAAGRLGQKAGGGFYRKDGPEIFAYDWRAGEYVPRREPEIPGLAELRRRPLGERLRGVLELPDPYGAFMRAAAADSMHYVLRKTPEVAHDIVSVDRAMEWGFGWELGPYRQMDAVGLDRYRALFDERGLDAPALPDGPDAGFYRAADGGTAVYSPTGYAAVPARVGVLALDTLRRADSRLAENDDAALLDLGDGVVLLELRARMGTLGPGVLELLETAIRRIEREDRPGLVIGREDATAFSAGANLVVALAAVREGAWGRLEEAVRAFQHATMGLRRAPFPVVVAPFGLTLGGGTELTLHADLVQAHAELYAGLVETGVGLIPGGGGTKELLFRFTEALAPYEGADPFAAVRRAFETIAMARTSTSALDARRLGFLRDRDRITMNRDRLLADAKARVLELAPDYTPPPPRTITALGRDALGNLRAAAWSLREARQITEHELTIAHELAYVLAGGDGAPRTVTEHDILDLEREAFLRLLGTPKTQERIAYTLETGKTLRN